MVENAEFLDQDVSVAEPSTAKSPRIENSVLEILRASEIKTLLIESQKEMLTLLKPKTGENVREDENDLENEIRSFYTPTKSVRPNSTQNKNPCSSRNSRVPKSLRHSISRLSQ